MKRPDLEYGFGGLQTYHVIEVIDRIRQLIGDYTIETERKEGTLNSGK